MTFDSNKSGIKFILCHEIRLELHWIPELILFIIIIICLNSFLFWAKGLTEK